MKALLSGRPQMRARRRTHWFALGFASLAAGALALSGCSSSGPAASGSSTGPAAGVTSSTEAGPSASSPAAGSGATTDAGGAAFSLTAPADIKDKGALNICADITYPPYTFMENNKPTGFDVEMADALAQAMGVRAVFHQTGFPGIIGALQGKKCDVIINGMNGTADHAKVINQVPYLQDSQGFITKTGSPIQIKSLGDLAGKSVVTQLGSTNAVYLQNLSKKFVAEGKPAIKITTLAQNPLAFESVLSGRTDVFYQDRPVLGYYSTKFPGQVTFADLAVNPQTVVIGLRKDEQTLTDTLEQGVKEMYQRGIMQKIATKWGIQPGNYLPGMAS